MRGEHEHCDSGHGCITCGDQALEMRVAAVDAARGLAMCVDDAGQAAEVDVLLVEPAVVGERLLVHARVAIARAEVPA
jgi:coenzyme F420-reducing hydrogenase gamma subunit